MPKAVNILLRKKKKEINRNRGSTDILSSFPNKFKLRNLKRKTLIKEVKPHQKKVELKEKGCQYIGNQGRSQVEKYKKTKVEEDSSCHENTENWMYFFQTMIKMVMNHAFSETNLHAKKTIHLIAGRCTFLLRLQRLRSRASGVFRLGIGYLTSSLSFDVR
ncbi:hypothetical protein CEXT_323311 [Caerostris extrusa]|uniref:Uncharacterized protein n=1 Tax=Caerostris extrusa TaxID=172846 RepID=A0AAV4VJS8_CAEEX|nr:hypothetical protein CEXT_323311 [Caerostris extrusa]